jgi:chromosome segregation ATPase
MSARDRFKRSLFGYRRSDVDETIAGRDAAVEAAERKLAGAEQRITEQDAELGARQGELERQAEQVRRLDQVSNRLAQRVVERERELRRLREELEQARAQREERQQVLTALGEDLDAVRGQARAQATRIRLRALREAAEVNARVSELDRGSGGGEQLTAAVEQAIQRVGSADEEGGPLSARARDNGSEESEAGELFEGLVEVEVGPLSDFAQLLGFEDAAGTIGAMSEISVRRFTRGRATLAMRLRQPVELLRELEQRAPFGFKVRDARSDRLVLDVAGE